jgi:hypothetical protein
MATTKEIDMKTLWLKTLVVAVSLAASTAYAAEAGAPFEITQFDRTLPNVPQSTGPAPASGGASVVPSGVGLASGVWANDHNFIAPAR